MKKYNVWMKNTLGGINRRLYTAEQIIEWEDKTSVVSSWATKAKSKGSS